MNQDYEHAKRAQQKESIGVKMADVKKLMALLKSRTTYIKDLNISRDENRLRISFFVLKIGALTNPRGDIIAALGAMDRNKWKLLDSLDKLLVFPPICIEDLERPETDDRFPVSFSIPLDKINLSNSNVHAVLDDLLSYTMEIPVVDIF